VRYHIHWSFITDISKEDDVSAAGAIPYETDDARLLMEAANAMGWEEVHLAGIEVLPMSVLAVVLRDMDTGRIVGAEATDWLGSPVLRMTTLRPAIKS